jgi:hypothetical protein
MRSREAPSRTRVSTRISTRRQRDSGIGSASGRPAIWRYLFTPATVAMGVGLTLIAYSVIKPDPIYTIGLLVLPAAAFAYVLFFYPRVAFAGEDFRSGDRRLT